MTVVIDLAQGNNDRNGMVIVIDLAQGNNELIPFINLFLQDLKKMFSMVHYATLDDHKAARESPCRHECSCEAKVKTENVPSEDDEESVIWLVDEWCTLPTQVG